MLASSSAVSILDSLPSQTEVLSLFSDEQITGACLEYLEQALAAVEHLSAPPTVRTRSAPAPSPNGGGVMMCLASVLEALSDHDERTVFSVRKINKLGFKSHSSLRKYFSSFGTVEAIYFLPYRYKPDTASIRPSSMAFVRMTSREAVDAIFAIGEVHMVRDVPVTVQPFTRTTLASTA